MFYQTKIAKKKHMSSIFLSYFCGVSLAEALLLWVKRGGAFTDASYLTFQNLAISLIFQNSKATVTPMGFIYITIQRIKISFLTLMLCDIEYIHIAVEFGVARSCMIGQPELSSWDFYETAICTQKAIVPFDWISVFKFVNL